MILSKTMPFFVVVPTNSGRAVYFDGDPSAPAVGLPGAFQMSHEQLHLLRHLYVSLPPDLQSVLATVLMGHIAVAPRVVTHALIDLRAIKLLLYLDQPRLELVCEIRTAMVDSITHRADFFNESDLADIATFADLHLRKGLEIANAIVDAPPLGRMPHVDAPIGEKLAGITKQIQALLTRIRYLRFRGELLDSGNPEINEDQRVLQGRIERLGLGDDLQDVLHEIDRHARHATVPTEFKGCMDLCRAVLETFFERAARLVALRRNRAVPESMTRSAFQGWRQYLRNEGLTTEHEDAVFERLYAFMSNAGVHSLGSAPEQVRVAKNTLIECMIFLAGRLEGL